MGVSRSADLDDFLDDDLVDGDFEEEGLSPRAERIKNNKSKSSWRSVEEYMENKRLNSQLSDVFDDWS